ncbi:MAG: serine/threonine protein kinase [Deltaproteobacteria bacterium]|nr:MAG: serine/threonine protein kinase [Deltaproteobacteria bacterium]
MLEPGEVVDRYTVEEILGQGGMAVVYRVRHNQLDSLHALKILTITNPGIKDRLLQEGKVQASLRHPNIVAVTDVLEVRGAPGLVMEFIEGPGLDGWLQQQQPTVDEAVRLFEGICLGVAHAHDKGVIHRDLKPANVMMAPASGTWVPKVADFGLAKAVTEDGSMQKTRSGVTMGTPQYMAPEQIRDAKSVDQRADVFSLGCILYELVCGRPPFVGPDILSIFNAVASGSFPAAVSLVPDLPPEVRDAIEGALVVDRDSRIGSVNQLLEVLRGAPLPESAMLASIERTQGGPRTWAPEMGVGVAASTERAPRQATSSGPGTGTLDPGSAPSLSSIAPTGRKLSLVAGVAMVGIGVVGALAVAGIAGGALFASNAVESSVLAALDANGDLGASGVDLGPTGLVITDFTIDGPDGRPVLEADSLRFEASPAAFRGNRWDVSRLVISGVSGELERGADGRFHLSAATEKLLRGGSAFGVKATEVVIEDGQLSLKSEGDALTVEWDGATLSDFDLGLKGGMQWTAGGGSISGLDVGAADPMLRAAEIQITDGRADVRDLELWVRGRTDGMLDLPPVIADEVADWAGGTRHEPEERDWLGFDLSGLPVAISELQASSGTLHLVERAHGVKTASWDVVLDRLSIGPAGGDRVPVGLSGALGSGRITVDGDVSRDGLIRLAVAGRYLPLDTFEPYIRPSLDRYQVKPSSGTVDMSLSLTAQRNTFAAVLELEGKDIAFEADGTPDRRGKRLLKKRSKIESTELLEMNLADQGSSPIQETTEAIRDLLFEPAGGGIVDAAKAAERERLRRQKEEELAAARDAAAEETPASGGHTTGSGGTTTGGGGSTGGGGTTTGGGGSTGGGGTTTGGGGSTGGGTTTGGGGGTQPEPSTEPAEDGAPTQEEVKETWQRVNRGVRDALDDFRIRKK